MLALARIGLGVVLLGACIWEFARRDVGLHLEQPQTFVPAWYPLLCVGFDLVVAGFLLGPAAAARHGRAHS